MKKGIILFMSALFMSLSVYSQEAYRHHKLILIGTLETDVLANCNYVPPSASSGIDFNIWLETPLIEGDFYRIFFDGSFKYYYVNFASTQSNQDADEFLPQGSLIETVDICDSSGSSDVESYKLHRLIFAGNNEEDAKAFCCFQSPSVLDGTEYNIWLASPLIEGKIYKINYQENVSYYYINYSSLESGGQDTDESIGSNAIIQLQDLCSTYSPFTELSNENYVLSVKPLSKTKCENSDLPSIRNVQYFDGLGRPKQNIAIKAGGQEQDIISHIAYDEFGRKLVNNMPYASNTSNEGLIYTSPQTELNSFYNTAKYENTTNPYSENRIENSPLSRVLEQGAPGADWIVNPTSDFDHTVKFDYGSNALEEVKQFSVNHPVNNIEKTELIFNGYFSQNQLYKDTSKDENWKPNQTHIKDNTTEEFVNKSGQIVLKRTFNENEPHDTHYIYDDFGNLTYVIPPLASGQIVDIGSQGFRVASQVNYPWVNIVEVDKGLAEEYNKKLSDYKNEDILNANLDNKYNGQGGFTVSTFDDNDLVILSIAFSANQDLQLKQGAIVSLKEYGVFKDTELGRISGSGYEYTLIIKNNSIVVSGKGKLSAINQTFNSGTKLSYSYNYPWTRYTDVNPKFAYHYEKQLAEYPNTDILNTYIENQYDGQGGVNVSIDENDIVYLTFNSSTNQMLKLKQGAVIPLNMKRRVQNRFLGTISGNGYNYDLILEDNNIIIKGEGLINSISINLITPPPPPEPTVSSETVEGLCYIYHYDTRNRLIEKKIPGKGWQYVVYDKLNRPILTQDAKLRINNEWLFTKYDKFSRTVYTGKYIHTPIGIEDNSGRLELQNIVNSQTNVIWHEVFLAGNSVDGLIIDYSNLAFPNNNLTVLSANYYDNYNFTYPSEINYSDSFGQELVSSTQTLSTGSKIRVLDTNHWTTSIMYYDEKGRSIFSASKNTFLNTLDVAKTQLDFSGRVLQTESKHIKGGNTPIVTVDRYTYDHINRLLTQVQTINDGQRELIVNNQYDELGTMESKKVGGSVATIPENSSGLQTVDYIYNARGWLKQINDVSNLGNDLFSFKVNYTNPEQTGSIALYNGNISETIWKTANDNQVRNYSYKYDALNRITEAIFSGGTFNFTDNVSMPSIQQENYSLKEVSYDKNGNILHLERYGIHNAYAGIGGNTTTDIVDGLDYFYETNSNKLLNVTDFADNGFDFIPNSGGIDNGPFLEKYQDGDKYEYDVNGNLVKDKNKNIDLIIYNHLNLPMSVYVSGNNSGVIHYNYDALGTKLTKQVNYSNGNTTTTKYAGNFTYEQTNLEEHLKFFNHPEGYIEPTNTGFQYVYQYLDHLGNVRLSYADTNGDFVVNSTEIIEEQNYYPFGANHKGYNNVITGTHYPYSFGGMETNEELGLNSLDFGARNYDPALGRWMNIDPFTELMYSYSPYNYGLNNPIYFFDADGNIPLPQIINYSRLSSPFGIRIDPITGALNGNHTGLDLTAPIGTNVRAAARGKVVKVGWNVKTTKNGNIKGYGRYIVIKHADGYYSLYGHLEKEGSMVKVGDNVTNGQTIATSGNTGGSTGPHLHFEIIKAKSLSGVFDKANKIDPQSIDDLDQKLHGPTKPNELDFYNSFDYQNALYDYDNQIFMAQLEAQAQQEAEAIAQVQEEAIAQAEVVAKQRPVLAIVSTIIAGPVVLTSAQPETEIILNLPSSSSSSSNSRSTGGYIRNNSSNKIKD